MNALALAFALCLEPEPDLPSLDDLLRFPPQTVTREMLRFYAGRREWLQAEITWQQMFRPWDDTPWGEELAAANWCYRVWDLLDDATIEGNSAHWRRERLALFRELLGPAAYGAGWLPSGR